MRPVPDYEANPLARCPGCGLRGGKRHHMSCRHYVGPIHHEWMKIEWSGIQGGWNHFCICGGFVRPESDDEKAVCPNEGETWRGIFQPGEKI